MRKEDPLSPLQVHLSSLLRSYSVDAKNVTIEADNAKLPLEDFIEANVWSSLFHAPSPQQQQQHQQQQNHSIDSLCFSVMDESHLSQRWETSVSTTMKYEADPSPRMRTPDFEKSRKKSSNNGGGGGMELKMKRPERRPSSDSLLECLHTPTVPSNRKALSLRHNADRIILQSPSPQLTLDTYPKTPPGTYFGRSLTEHQYQISPMSPGTPNSVSRFISTRNTAPRRTTNTSNNYKTEARSSGRRKTMDDRCAPTPPVRRNTSDLQSMRQLLRQLAIESGPPLGESDSKKGEEEETVVSATETSTCPSFSDYSDDNDDVTQSPTTTTITSYDLSTTTTSRRNTNTKGHNRDDQSTQSSTTTTITSYDLSPIKGHKRGGPSSASKFDYSPSPGQTPVFKSSALPPVSFKFAANSACSPNKGKASRRDIANVIDESIAISKSGRGTLMSCPL
jgi:hypothetical protein